MPQKSPASSSTNSPLVAAKGTRDAARATATDAFRSNPTQQDRPENTASPDRSIQRKLSGAFMIQIDRIEPDPDQPRKRIDAEHIDELSASIRQLGVLQPITVRYIEASQMYWIIAGECRFRASQQAGLTEVPCWVRTPEQNQILLQQVIENWQRSDLNPFELAESLGILLEANGYSQKRLASITGKSPGEISKILSLLDLPDQVQAVAREDLSGQFSKRHLYALKSFEPEQQLRIVDGIQKGRYTAEAIEMLHQRRKQAAQQFDLPRFERRTFKT